VILGELEDGFEKVVIYVGTDGKPRHAAWQLISGQWSSKLGQEEDIRHKALDGVAGEKYGQPAIYLKRIRRRFE
jgi:hypothetical protein